MGEEAEQKRALGVRGKMISSFFHQLSLKQGQICHLHPPTLSTSHPWQDGGCVWHRAEAQGSPCPAAAPWGWWQQLRWAGAALLIWEHPAPLLQCWSHAQCQGSCGCPAPVLPAGTAQRAPLALPEPVPKALKARFSCPAAGAGSQWQPQRGHQHCPQLHLAKGQVPAQQGCASHSSKPLPALQDGEQGHPGKPPTAWMEQMAEQTVPGFLFHIIFCPAHSHT